MTETKTWLVWDEPTQRWHEGRDDGRIDRLARDFLNDADKVARRKRWGDMREGPNGLLSNRTRRALIEMVRTEEGIAARSAAFDSDPHLMGVANGVVDLRRGRLLAEPRDAKVMRYSDVPFTKGARSEKLKSFLCQATGGDHRYQGFLQRALGSSLIGVPFEERFYLLYGPGGTGKSTLLNACIDALGPYALTLNPDSLQRQSSGTIREDLASLNGVRLAVNQELPNAAYLDATMIKTLTGRDPIRARGLWEKGKVFSPTWHLFAACNVLPNIQGNLDSGWWRRVVVLPFHHVPARPDPQLKVSLLEEREAILNWLIQGAYKFRHDLMRNPQYLEWKPDVVLRATGMYRAQHDHFQFWLDGCVVHQEEGCVSNAEIWASYQGFCERWGVPESAVVKGSTQLGKKLSRLGFDTHHDGVQRYRTGLRLVRPDMISGSRFIDAYVPCPMQGWGEETGAYPAEQS